MGGAGGYVGRVGGLALALGIGGAVVAGQGTAFAETTGGTDSDTPSATTSEPGDVRDSVDISSETPKAEADEDVGASDADDDKPVAKKSRHRNRSGDTDRKTRMVLDPDTSTLDTSAKKDLDKKDAPELRVTTHDAVESVQAGSAVDEPPAVISTPRGIVSSVLSAVFSRQDDARPTPVTAPVRSVVSNLLDVLVGPLASGDSPTAPAEPPLAWMAMAVARRELFASPAIDALADSVTNGLLAPTDGTYGMHALATWQSPLVPVLTQVPILGPAVPSIAEILRHVPVLNVPLAPFIGYAFDTGIPVDVASPDGTPIARTGTLISYDGTPIRVNFYPAQGLAAGEQAPTVIMGPGLALPGATDPTATTDQFLGNDQIGMADLLANGYNVVTYDPRGEWWSGGLLQIDHPDVEARDVSAIIDWVDEQPEAADDFDAEGDPAIGMVGGSYGGGIQLVTAAHDPRVDAIVPTIAWHNLTESLYLNDATKTSWGAILLAGLTFTLARPNPRIYPAMIYALLTGTVRPADQAFLEERGPDYVVDDITAPTLLVQGTVDTLFGLNEAHENAEILIENGVPTKMVWICGGHGACLVEDGDEPVVDRVTLDWLNRYVKGDNTVDTGPAFEWVDQNGDYYSSAVYPALEGDPVVVEGADGGFLPLIPGLGGSGPQWKAFGVGLIQGFFGLAAASKALNAVNVELPEATETTYVVGAPEVEFTYSGIGASRHVYAQLVDDDTGLVLGNIATPVPVTLDGQTHTAKVSLEQVAHTLQPGQSVTLQIVSSTTIYQSFFPFGGVDISDVKVTLPTAGNAVPVGNSSV